MCLIDEDKYVLDVGCGIGKTPHHIAKKYGCRVVGVDISGKMLDKARERAKREPSGDRVEFRLADAKSLIFEDDLFDMVICESVLAFLINKQRGINELVQVTKENGYVGLNEATWIKAPPAEFVKYISSITGAEFETYDSWKKLIEGSGLRNVEVRTYKISLISQFVNEMKYMGLRDFAAGWLKFLSLGIRSSAFREYIKKARPPKSVFKKFCLYFGYSICVGRK